MSESLISRGTSRRALCGCPGAPRIADLYSDPDDSNDYVHALGLAAVILEAPEAVILLVPEGLGGRVHAAAAYVGLPVSGGGVGAGGDVRFVGLGLAAALGLVETGGGHQVLHNGAVDHVLVRRSRARGGRLCDDALQDVVL